MLAKVKQKESATGQQRKPGQTPLDQLARHWLNLQCSMLQGVTAAIVVLPNLREAPSAFWPHANDDYSSLASLAAEAIRAGRCAIRTSKSPGSASAPHLEMIAYPIELNDETTGAVAVQYTTASERRQQSVINLLRWGCEWLKFTAQQNRAPSRDHFMPAVHMIAACLDKDHFDAMATSLVTELATRFSCERASLGLFEGRSIRIKAVSHSASARGVTNLSQLIAGAMEEAVDQDATIVFPEAREKRGHKITRAHRELANSGSTQRICTIPVCYCGELCGALTMEWRESDACSPIQVQLFEQVATVIGPLVILKQRDELSLFKRSTDAARRVLKKLFGPAHFRLKLSAAIMTALLVFFSFYQVDYKVTANAVLEGDVQRVLAAPLDSFITAAHARAGDIVTEGQLLGTLDDKDLRLERLKWLSEKSQYAREHRDALAKRDNAEVSILMAQIRQAEARIALLDEQLKRVEINAPFDGVIIEGDPTRSLGAPVRRGDLLFKIAPLNDYRVVLEVDERDIAALREGQTGQLSLASLPGNRMDLKVTRITPVSVARDGANHFRVEASLLSPSDHLRPGMEGVGKVVTERRHLIWVWSHSLMEWLSLRLWAWLP